MECAENTLAGKPHGVLHQRHAPPLRAGLEDPFRAAEGFGDLLAVAHRDAAGLLAIDVLARLGREDRGLRMPAVAGRDQDRIDVGPIE